MSRRRRGAGQATAAGHIEWLRHRTGYPSAEERERILQLRKQLSGEIIALAISRPERDDPRLQALMDKYGKEEVQRAEQAFRDGMDSPSLVADEARSNREYRLRYSRFGAGLPFLTETQRDEMYEKYAQSFDIESENEVVEGRDVVRELEKLLLMDWRDWEDLTPPAVPARPEDYRAPVPNSYAGPITELLEWGNDLQKHHDFADQAEFAHWSRSIPGLTRMALDPGLLQGWPAENASWAPWHAIHMLGNLQAWDSIPALAELTDLEDDWLSDHLPHIWASMGREAELMLWIILEDRSASAKRRGLAAEALAMMAEEDEVIYNKASKGFGKILMNETSFDPTLNGYLISFLRSMQALDKVSQITEKAFDQGRVDLDIITPEDIEADEFEEDCFEEDG